MTETNTSLFLGRHKQILSWLGIWMWSQNSRIYQIYMILVVSTQYVFVIFEVVYIANVWGDMEAVTEASFLLFSQTAVCCKTTSFMAKEKSLAILLDFMDSEVFKPQCKKHERILFQHSRRIKRLGVFFLTSALTACTLWAMIPLFSGAGTRSFPFMIWMPVTPEKSPSYEIGYLCQMLAIYIGAFFFIVLDSVAFSMIMFCCAQLKIVMEKLEQVQSVPSRYAMDRMTRDKLVKSNNELFIECIRRHQAVLGFIEIVENMFHANIFFQLMGTVAIICNIGLRIEMVENGSVQFYSMLNFMASMLIQLFFYSWIGQELTTRSEELRDALYQCPWYEQDIKYRRAMWIAMERMKKPIIFRPGHYVQLSRSTFITILRCSYSYFAVLNQTDSQ